MKLKLQVGKTYLNNLGEKITIISMDKDPIYPFNCENYSYTPEGRYHRSYSDELDLVTEYINPQ